MVSLSARPRISVVIPMLNEERNIPALLGRLFQELNGSGETFEVLCVDDGSKDGTLRLLREAAEAHPELKVISLARNFGQHAAIIAGFDASKGDWVITIDADLQNPPEEIPRLLEEFRKGHDLIGTYREERQDSLFRKAASWMVNRMMRNFSKIEIRDFGCMLRGYSGEVAHAIASQSEYKTFIPALGTLYAGNPTEIPVRHAKRAQGTSKYSFLRLVSLALDLVTCFSLWPLRMLSLCGLVIFFSGFLFGLLLLALRLYHGPDWAAQGVFTLFAVLFLFIGAQFIAFGLLGEYIGRIFQEVRERPLYVVRRQATASPDSKSPESWGARGLDQEPVPARGGKKSLDDGGS